MEASELFLSTFDELERYVALGDEYSMLRASALLRQLLMDASPLLHQANRSVRLRITFPICGHKYRATAFSLAPDFYSAIGGIHTSGSLAHQLVNVKVDEFLKTKVLKLGTEMLSIDDLISISANVLGGVHAGQPKTEKEEALISFDARVRFGSQALNPAQMKPIVLVALDAFRPLKDELLKSRK